MSNQFTLGVALDQPDDTKMTLTNVIITKSELKMTKTNKSYHSCTVEGDGQKTYVSIYGNAPQFLNEPVNISDLKIGSWNGKRNFIGGQYSKVTKATGAIANSPSAPAAKSPYTPPPSAPNQAVIHGATAGMVVKAAVDIWRQNPANTEWAPEAMAKVYCIAKDILTISQAIEGNRELPEQVPF